jgi:PAS domain S-box-containing protein
MSLVLEDLNAIVENSPVLIWKANREGSVEYFSESWLKYTGRSHDLEVGDGWREGIHPEDVQKYIETYDKHFKQQSPFEIQYRLKRYDGVYRWILDKVSPQIDQSGQFKGYIGYCFDITDTRKAEEETLKAKELAESNEHLAERIAENFPNSYISVIEDDFTIGFTSGQEFTNQGLNPQDFIGLNVRDVFGELADKVISEYNKSFAGKENRFELEINNQFQLYRTVPFFNDQGKVNKILAVSENITAARQHEQELQNAKESAEQTAKELKEAQKVASLASWHLDIATDQVTWSEELYKMYGFDPSLPPPPYTEQMKIFTPESWETLSRELAKTQEEGIPYELELNFVREDKSRGWMWVKGEAVFDEQDVIVGLRGVAQDITERKNLAIELQHSKKVSEENEKRLLVASNSAHLGIWEWDVQEDSLIWDNRMYELYDYDIEKDTPSFQLWAARIHPEDKEQTIKDVNDALEGIREFSTSFRVIHPNGKEFYLSGHASVLRDHTGRPTRMIGVNRDITESRSKERILENQNKQLIDFSNIIAHNLRAPLVNIQLLVDYIEQCDDAEKRNMFIGKQRSVLNHLNEVFNELMESIQIRQDKEIPSDKIILSDQLDRTLKGLESQINEYKAQINVDFDAAPIIHYPTKYIDSILSNIVSNSLKYRSPKRNPIINIRTKRVNDDVILSISDNGLGIDMTLAKKHIFKIRKVFHDHPDAKGFGLFLIKTQIDTMGGDIWVESTPEQGSTFYVKFINQ